MTNFFHAFTVVFCLMSFGIISLALGLGLINPFLGLIAILSCVVGIYSTAGALE